MNRPFPRSRHPAERRAAERRATAHRAAERPIEHVLRDSPALLLSRLQDPAHVDELVASWNPHAAPADDGGVVPIADGVRWHGPIALAPMVSADAALPPGWSIGYVAEAARQRRPVPDSREAPRLCAEYPQGLPVGAELVAWRLVRGLARILHGAARLPGSPPVVDHPPVDLVVYGHEALPWPVLREVVGLVMPDVVRSAALGPADYTLDQDGVLTIHVGPAEPADGLPYAVRQLADDGWPHTVYRFTGTSTERVARCARLVAEVVGGVLLDADGFPVSVSSRETITETG